MNNSNLKLLLKEYEQKRLSAHIDLDKRKQKLYASCPRLEEIESEINQFAFGTAKTILTSSSTTNPLSELQDKICLLNEEKKTLLMKLHISDSFFLPNYECSLCEDTGYIQSSYGSSLCNCIKQKLFDLDYNKANIGNLKQDTFNSFDFSLYSDEINEEKYHSKSSPKENVKTIVSICHSFINNFDSSFEKNLLFTGNTGLGKTFLSNCIANEILSKDKTVLYQTAPIMLDTIIDYRFGRTSNSVDIYKNILEVDLLIIDDLGTEYMNAIKFTELFNVINTRLLNQNNHITKTIISTNLSLQNLHATYDERIFSRLVGYYNLCRFFGDDIRFLKR